MRPVALITGGTRGIGLGIAEALSADGWNLALCGLRSDDEVAGVVASLARSGASVTYCRADVSVAADRSRLLDDMMARHGRLDALVNNAGRAPSVRADLLDAAESSFETLVRTNLQGPYFLTQAAARVMLQTKQQDRSSRSAIVFITSVSAELASTNRGDYCVSKAGLAMAVKLFAARLAADGIPVYEIRPGIVETDMTAGVREIYDRRIADGLVPQARWGTPADVGRAVAALLGGNLAYSTGSVIHVDGGLSIGRL
jgi:NAD(P)-dependent dehydrogenase (short-subunit alcohol dehydrogenase family)